MERVIGNGLMDMALDVGGETGIDLVQDILAIPERPHFAHGFIAHAGDDAADFKHHRINGAALVGPILLFARQAVADGEALALLLIGHDIAVGRLMLHVIDAGADIDHGLEHGMARHILDALAIDPHFASVTERLAVLFAGSDHFIPSQFRHTPEGAIAINQRLGTVALGVHHAANEYPMGARIL